MNYLTDDDLGGVIVKGLADLYKTKPKYPVTYLEEFFRRYLQDRDMERRTKQNIKNLKTLERQVVEDEYIKWETEKKRMVTLTRQWTRTRRAIQRKSWQTLHNWRTLQSISMIKCAIRLCKTKSARMRISPDISSRASEFASSIKFFCKFLGSFRIIWIQPQIIICSGYFGSLG